MTVYEPKVSPHAAEQLKRLYCAGSAELRARILAAMRAIADSLATDPWKHSFPCKQPGFRVADKGFGPHGNRLSLAAYFAVDETSGEVRIVQIELISPPQPIR